MADLQAPGKLVPDAPTVARARAAKGDVFDRLWRLLYLPIQHVVQRAANAVSVLQQGRISAYLLYSFVTLLVMLVLVFR